MNPQLKELYKSTLLRHSKQPRNTGIIENADATETLRNPLCGDEITVYLKANRDSVSRIQFVAQCCSICSASASMMTERLAQTSPTEALAFADSFVAAFRNRAAPDFLEGDLSALAGVFEFPSRIRCATLPFEALSAALAALPETQPPPP